MTGRMYKMLLGSDPTAVSLASLDGKQVSGRRVVARKIPALSGLKVNAKLLSLGKSVRGRNGGEK
jgi:hypothetical protein